MATIPTTGLGSGLDVQGLVSQLMTVEQQPLDKLKAKEAAVQLKVSAYGTFRGSVSAFQQSLAGLENSSIYGTNKGSVSDSSIATVSASATSDLGSHTLEVSTLAVAQRLKSGTFTNITDTVGTGTLTIDYGTYDKTANTFSVNADRASQKITIDAAHNTLAGVRDAINAAKIGVSASIVNDGGGNRLVVSSTSTGTVNSVRISATDDDGNNTDTAGLSQLAYDPTAIAGSGNNMTQVVAAADAKFTLDGLDITKSSNSISDVLTGTTLNLVKTNVGNPVDINVAQDTTGVKTAVDAFIKAYNDLNDSASKLGGYDASTKTAGTLQGEAALSGVMGQIRDGLNAMSSSVNGGFAALPQIGITFDRSGDLQVDAAKLQKALASNPAGVRGLFATGASSPDSLISYKTSASSTRAGTYSVNVAQLATKGNVVGSAAANLTIDASNDAFTATVNGVTTTVSLTQQTYASADALAAELQTKLNGSSAFSNGGVTVSVTQSNGVLSLSSNLYGSTSKIALGGGTAQDGLFGSAPTATDGLDVAGAIGGVIATGKGQELAAPNGLTLSIAGGSTGERGNIVFTRGVAVTLDNLLTKALGTKGTLTAATDGLNTTIKDYQAQESKMSDDLEVKKDRYTQQFNTLDGLLTSMQSTMSYLTQQLASLNSSTK
jgi:flagellar hook-associated protein 2